MKNETSKDIIEKDSALSMRTLRVRIKDKHAAFLKSLAFDVNQVWNYCNELSFKVFERERRFMSGFDLQKYTNGVTKEGLSLHSATVQAICSEYATRRKQFKKTKLKWRKSNGSRRSLGWIPFKASGIKYINGQIQYGKTKLSLWDSYGLSNYDLTVGSFAEDAQGKWYFNVAAKLKQKEPTQLNLFTNEEIGIDLGVKEFLATSNGIVVQAEKFYRKLEDKLAIAQRANKTARVKAIHAKIKNQRKDFNHKLSTDLAKRFSMIFVGNVNASALAKTNMAKSVLDAGWSQFRTMLQYKCDGTGTWFEEVNESFSTQICSACKTRSGPKGLEGLGIREWTCSTCGTKHHRDINSAKNILACGHARLAAGILGL
jgi:putative transposase